MCKFLKNTIYVRTEKYTVLKTIPNLKLTVLLKAIIVFDIKAKDIIYTI